MMEIVQGNRGSFMKSASVLRQFDPIAAAIKEFETQACLKPRHGRENGRVRPVEGIASGLETAQARHGVKAPQLMKLEGRVV